MPQKAEKQKVKLTLAYNEYKKCLSSYASFRVSNSALTDDLVQDTFIRTWLYIAKGGEIVKMKAFLYHVLNGLIVDEYRKRKNLSLDTLIENGHEPVIENTESESNLNVFDGKIAVLLISHLPRNYQKIMRMRYVQDLSLSEIASITGKSKNAMAVQAHRGLEKLKILYFHQGDHVLQ